jgi:predicted ATP-dependent protease
MPGDLNDCKLTLDQVRFETAPDQLGFADTSQLQPLDAIVGQPRATEALDLGVGVRHQEYHIYAAGLTGTGRLKLVQQALQERIGAARIPDDWVYVNNFNEPDRPLAINLPAGQGRELRSAVQTLIETLVESLPKAFREEDFSRERDRIGEQYRKKGEEIFHELETHAAEHQIAVKQLPDGEVLFIPLRDGKPMSPDEIKQLSPDELEELQRRQDQMLQTAGKLLERQQEMQLQLTADVRQVVRSFATRLVAPLVAAIAQRFTIPRLLQWLEQLQQHVVDHLDRFRLRDQLPPEKLGELLEGHDLYQQKPFLDYHVNVLVDNSGLPRPPVVIESAPNYKNLFGTIERIVDRYGRVTTNFTRIKAGSLLRANGGCLVFDLLDALTEPFVWKELKRTLKAGVIEIEVYDPFAMFTVSALSPEPIPLSVRLVVAGPPLVYHLLCLYDEDFSRLFRVKADFDVEIRREADGGRLYGQFVRKLSDTEGTLPFTAGGVAELLRTGARLSGDRQKLSTEFTLIGDVVREADYWARKESADRVTEQHVQTALNRRIYRSDLIAEKIRELIADGTLLIEVQGTARGQVNGLAVYNLGDYAFARPSRVSASVGVGTHGIVNIERESRLSGKTFDKGLLILDGYLRNLYAQRNPLSLSAAIAMEQSYGGIDGDSASVAELLCLLGALAGTPLRQDVAVTGSINQAGQVQAIGGVNEKIEGFFDVCQAADLSSSQGVCFPRSNVRNLVLRPDVVEAVEQGKFHLWAIDHVDQAIELFSGIPAGNVDQPETFHGRVQARLTDMLESLKKQPPGQQVFVTPGAAPAAPPPDPRPPLPGRDGG